MIRVICTNISELDDTAYRQLYAKASRERKNRADRYYRREDALRCLAAEALLRYVLGADTYIVEKMPNGKPYIKDVPDFHFNLSHSGCWVVIACGDSEVGVDVEQIRGDVDIQAIAGQFFSPEEQCYVWENPAQSRQRFFTIWTGKESYIKYLGTGLQKDLTSFSVLSPELQVHLHHRKIGEDYCLSLCTEENDYLFELLDVQRL